VEPEQLQIHILYFGFMHDRITGTRQERQTISPGTRLQDLIRNLYTRYAGLEAVVPRVRIAVNEGLPPPGYRLRDGDVVAFLPPVAGG
jgi:molybdopterin converting factor small subunit